MDDDYRLPSNRMPAGSTHSLAQASEYSGRGQISANYGSTHRLGGELDLTGRGQLSTNFGNSSRVGAGVYRASLVTTVGCDICMRRPSVFFCNRCQANFCNEDCDLMHSFLTGDARREHNFSAPRKHEQETSSLLQRGKVGIGVQLERDFADGSVRVKQIIPNSSAAKSDQVQLGDLLVQVDGTPVANLSVEELAEAIQGSIGTVVELGLLRPHRMEGLFFVTLARGGDELVRVPYVRQRYDNVRCFLNDEERQRAQLEARDFVQRLRTSVFPQPPAAEHAESVHRSETYITGPVRYEQAPHISSEYSIPTMESRPYVAGELSSLSYVPGGSTGGRVISSRVVEQPFVSTVGYERSTDSVDDPGKEVLKA